MNLVKLKVHFEKKESWQLYLNFLFSEIYIYNKRVQINERYFFVLITNGNITCNCVYENQYS